MAIDFGPIAPFTQDNRNLRIKTSLGSDVLVLRELKGSEGISQLYQFELDLLSEDGAIKPQDIVGDNVSITLESENDTPRLFNGYVKRFQYAGLEKRGYYHYKAEIVPWFWFLDKTSDCKVFQNLSIQEIVESIFTEAGFTDFEFCLMESHSPLEYCVQYCETDYQFICRLFESEGMYYFFEHQEGKAILHIADNASYYQDLSPAQLEHSSGIRDQYYINAWHHHYQHCSGSFTQMDFDYEKFNQKLLTETPTAIPLKNNSDLDRFDYPGSYKDNEQGNILTKLRMQQEEMSFEEVRANSNVHFLELGKKFTLTSDENEVDNNQVFVVTQIQHAAINPGYLEPVPEAEKKKEDTPFYTNQFSCIPAATTFRPQSSTPVPRIDSVQTALVVGPSGEEIYTDEYGRIKVQFHWDRYGKKNEQSSCWVRVASSWAGAKWGTVAIPRIGNEVVVSFVNGNPDNPLITGCVYNSVNKPPYDLPGSKTSFGMKSRSTKSDKSSFNEISIDDNKESEQVKINAQKDFNITVGHDLSSSTTNNASNSVGVDSSYSVGNDRTSDVSNNDTSSVGVDQTSTVGSNSKRDVGADDILTIGTNQTIDVGADQASTIGSNQDVSVGANQDTSIGGNHNLSVTGDQVISALSQDVSITTSAATSALDVAIKGQKAIDLTVMGSSISITPAGITLSMGPSSVKIDPSGVTISGLMVKLN